MHSVELNLDGLVGPTHNYAGLSPGNLLSAKHAGSVAHPRAAALQGLAKMRHVAALGIPQAVLPPQLRPSTGWLNRIGFTGTDEEVIARASAEAPALLTACCSASGMWTANSATVSPSSDTADGRVHMTPANLTTLFHRSIEADWTANLLREVFASRSHFVVHDPLPGAAAFSDEGAANHTRLAGSHDDPGIEFFVHGRDGIVEGGTAPNQGPRRFAGRQTREASEAVARLHGLDPGRVVFARQSPEAIDAGVFHNDVIAVGNERVFLYHEQAFEDAAGVLGSLGNAFAALPGDETGTFLPLCVQQEELTLEDASACYLFNSQLLTLPGTGGDMLLLAPTDCRDHPRAERVLSRLVGESNPISRVEFIDVRQSMRNGGGPACLRLRVVLTEDELAHMHQGVLLTEALHDRLSAWVHEYYREELSVADLADPALGAEALAAGQALEDILQINVLSNAE